MTVPYVFANATSAIPLSQLDNNFATPVTIGNVAIQLGNTVSTIGNVTLNSPTLNNATAANVTITSVSTPITAAQGGTGSSSAFTTNGVAYASSTSALATGSSLVWTGSALGIGTSSPSATLEVNGAIKLTSGNFSVAPTTTTSAAVTICTNSGGTFFAGLDSSTGGTFGVGNYSSVLYNGANTPMVFFTNATERMRIDSSGRLLVATTSAADSTVRTQSGSTSNDGRIEAWLSTSNNGSYGVLQLGAANTGTNTECTIHLVSGATALGNSPTSANGTQYDWGIGLGPYSVGGNVFAVSCTANGGPNVKLNYNSSSWISVSDERIKNITANIEDANQIIANWRTVYYTLKSDETNSVKIGLIAQDVQKTLPEVIDVPTREYDDNNKLIPLGVHYSEVVPVLVKAIQELSALVTAQSATITSLTERITALEAK